MIYLRFRLFCSGLGPGSINNGPEWRHPPPFGATLSLAQCVYTHTRCSHLLRASERAAESYTRALRRRLKPQAINHLGRFFGAPRLILPAARGARIRRGPFACELSGLSGTHFVPVKLSSTCVYVCCTPRTSSVCMCVCVLAADLIGEKLPIASLRCANRKRQWRSQLCSSLSLNLRGWLDGWVGVWVVRWFPLRGGWCEFGIWVRTTDVTRNAHETDMRKVVSCRWEAHGCLLCSLAGELPTSSLPCLLVFVYNIV